MNRKEVLAQSVNMYLISESVENDFQYNCNIFDDKYKINYSSKQFVTKEKYDEMEVCVVGYCIDSHAEIKKDDVAKRILSVFITSNGNICKTYRYTNRFAGKYMILLKNKDRAYIIPDATCTMQIFYSFKNGFAVSCLEKMVADSLELKFDDRNMRIRKASNYSQAMPNDITVYDSLYALLPNHYLDISQQKAVRVPCYGDIEKYKKYSENEILEMSYKRIQNIVKAYNEDRELICPLTGGRDSRACYGLLKQVNPYMQTYTFIHEGFTEKTPDYKIPLELNVPGHKFIKDMEMPKEEYEDIKNIVGEFIDKKDIIDNAYTFREAFGDAACINGDIVDQVGGANVICGVSEKLLTPKYLSCKIHNKSDEAIESIKKWQINFFNNDKQYIADLYSIESRLGRWSGQWYSIYNLLGTERLNFFNGREILLMWISLSEIHRTHNLVRNHIHVETLTSQEQHIPYNGNNKIYESFRKQPALCYIATYLKHFIMD